MSHIGPLGASYSNMRGKKREKSPQGRLTMVETLSKELNRGQTGKSPKVLNVMRLSQALSTLVRSPPRSRTNESEFLDAAATKMNAILKSARITN